ncbi:MAG: S-adenosylmethionine decarboxylase proenzyme [Candidatus Poseidoniaceae archaeon]|nr:MAG: S-adenosylmethionine decarboxylase proenzyme [Candidatus Poseidoniaceae archaeon]
MPSKSRGKHIFLDCTEFFPTSSFDGNDMLELMQRAVEKSNAKEVHAHVELFDGSTSPPGFAAVVLLDESHVSAHCYSDRGLLAIDAFTCGGTDPTSIVEELKQALYELSPTTVLMQHKSADRFLLPEV